MADHNVGDRVPSALDSYYQNYVRFCERLGYRPATYAAWLRSEHPASSTKMGNFQVTRAQHEARKSAYRAKLATEAQAALQP